MPHRPILPSLLILSASVVFYTCQLEYHHGSGSGGNATPIVTIQVIGHRGASALRPEYTLASYQKAIDGGANIIEPDLVSTGNGVLAARHEDEISGTTNVADVATFVGRKTTKTIDGQSVTGWFAEDFMLGELETLHARKRIPNTRPDNVTYDDQLNIPTFDEIIVLARDQSAKLGRNIGIYPKAKYPTYFQSIDLPLEDRLIGGLRRNAFMASRTTVYIQSFKMANLKAIHNKISDSQPNWKLVQLMGTSSRQPYDFVVTKDDRTFDDMMTSQGMRSIAAYANSAGPDKSSITSLDASSRLTDPTDPIRNTYNAGLVVHPYTFRPENTSLPPSLRSSADSTHSVDGSITGIQVFLRTGVDGFSTDDPVIGRQAVSTFKC